MVSRTPSHMFVVLFLLVLTCVTPHLATAHTLSLLATPPRWGLPSTYEYTMKLDAPLSLDVLGVRMAFLHGEGEYTSVYGPKTCNVYINSMPTPLPDPVDSAHGSVLIHKSALPEGTEITSFRFTCARITLQRPVANPPQAITDLQAVVQITSPESGTPTPPPLAEASAMMQIVDLPFMYHQYMWASSDSAAIAVTFTFYRPGRLATLTDFEIYHPLLDLTKISSIHPRPTEYDGDQFVDLSRPYHLLSGDNTTPSVVCQAFTGASDKNVHLLFNPPNTASQTGFPFQAPTTTVGMDYSCTFTIEYPPDVLLVMLEDTREGTNPSEPPEAVITYPEPTNSDPGTVVIPLTKPLRILDWDEPTIPNGLHIWVSPHHHPFRLPSFEFGIAITDLYLTTTLIDTHPIEPVMSFITISLDILTHSNPDDPVVLSEFEPRLQCQDHTLKGTPMEISITDGKIDLPIQQFGGFGQRCRIRFASVPPITKMPYDDPISIRFHPSGATSTTPPAMLTVFDTMHRYSHSIELITLHHISASMTDQLQVMGPPQQIRSTFETDDDINYAVIKMNVQYLPIFPAVDTHNPALSMQLSLIFPDYHTLDQLILPPSQDSTTISSLISVFSGSYALYDQVPMETLVIQDSFENVVSNMGTVGMVFQYGRAIRSPTLTLMTPLPYVSSQPLQVVWRFPVQQGVPAINAYPILLPTGTAPARVYTPIYARITPVRETPLTGYSYRCVKWDHMVAPYMYGINVQPPLTDDNSFPCPSYVSPDTNQIDVSDEAIWRRVEYTSSAPVATGVSSTITCLHEVSALCVTPSTTVEGAYDIHPLADCPSFLDETHAIPCHLTVNPHSKWEYYLKAVLNSPTSILVNTVPFLDVSWVYHGDPRFRLRIQSNTANGYVRLAEDLPMYLLPFVKSKIPPMMRLRLPYYEPIDSMSVRMTTPRVSIHPAIQYKHSEPAVAACASNAHKRFDGSLCTCQVGYLPSMSLDPFVDPRDFTCTSMCDDGFIWNPYTKECVKQSNGGDGDSDGDDGEDNRCGNYGVMNATTGKCTCFDGYFGEACQYDDADDVDYVCEQLECVAEHLVDDDDDANECKIDVDVDADNTTTVVCNCADGFTGDQCQHQAVCGVRQCVNGRLVSPTGKPEECKCECNSSNITGSACNQCTLQCRNGGVANTRCTACQCPAGYIGTTCTIPVWYHTFTLRNLPQHIVELILGTTASDKEEMAILQQTMVKYLLEDYSRVLSETFIVVDGNGNGDNDGNPDDNDTRIRVRVELSQFQTVIPPANPNAPYVHIQLMLYPADMTDEMLAYALQHGLVFDWSRVTDNLDFFKQFLREQGIVDDSNGDDGLTPEIIDPGCTTRECRDKIIEDESSNDALPLFTSALASTLSLFLVAMFTVFSA